MAPDFDSRLLAAGSRTGLPARRPDFVSSFVSANAAWRSAGWKELLRMFFDTEQMSKYRTWSFVMMNGLKIAQR